MINFYLDKISQFSQYDIYFYFSLFFLIILIIISNLKIEENKKKKIFLVLFLLNLLIFISWSIFLSIGQYLTWKNHPISRYLLPPYQKLNYFLSYAYFHFWRDLIFRIISATIVFLFLKFLNFIFQRDIFYDEEKILVPYISVFFFFPYNLLFVSLSFFVLLLIIMKEFIKIKNMPAGYFSFKNYWLYLALILFFIQPFFLTNYQFLKFKP